MFPFNYTKIALLQTPFQKPLIGLQELFHEEVMEDGTQVVANLQVLLQFRLQIVTSHVTHLHSALTNRPIIRTVSLMRAQALRTNGDEEIVCSFFLNKFRHNYLILLFFY